MKNGEILRGPPERSAACSLSITSNPPTPEPICTPTRCSFSGVTFSPDMVMASSAAAMARWMKRPIFLTSFFSMKFKGSKPFTSAAIWQAKLPASKWVIFATPLLPATMFFQTSALVLPTPQISPRPVTTTRLANHLPPFECFSMYSVASFTVRIFSASSWDFNIKGLFKSHDKFHGVKRIRAEIIHEGGIGRHFALIHSELLNNDLFNLLLNCCHRIVSPSFFTLLNFYPGTASLLY